MAKLEGNTSVFDLVMNQTGSINNVIQFIEDNGLETVNDNLLGFEIDPYTINNFSNELKLQNRIIATRELVVSASTGGAFDSGYDSGYEI